MLILSIASSACRHRFLELPQAGAAAGGEEVDVAAGDGLPALRLRLHRRVLPVQGHPARRLSIREVRNQNIMHSDSVK